MARDLRRTLVAAAAAAAVLLGAGCGPSADKVGTPTGAVTRDPSPTGVPAPTPYRLSHRDLVRALPRLSTLTAWRHPVECRRRGVACSRLRTPHGVGRGVFLSADGTEDIGLSELLMVSVVAWPTAAAAQARTADVGHQMTDDFEGSFDRAIDWTSPTHYHPGQVGHGHVRRVTVGPWRGFERDAVFRYVRPQLRASKPIRELYVTVRRGRYTVQAQVSRWLDRPAELRADPRCTRCSARSSTGSTRRDSRRVEQLLPSGPGVAQRRQ